MVTPSTHIRYADVAVVVYDVTESNTVDALSNWLEKAVLFGPEHLTIILCGNKTDISRDEWQDNAATLRQMKQKNRVSGHVMTSAKEEGGLQALIKRRDHEAAVEEGNNKTRRHHPTTTTTKRGCKMLLTQVR